MDEARNQELRERARATDCLQARIGSNVGGQTVDLGQWIFERLPVAGGASVLELCCGTGAQSQILLERVGPTGTLVALDASADAVATVESQCGPQHKARLIAVQGELDAIPSALASVTDAGPFDLVFCAYGLYYSSDVAATLNSCAERLAPSGRIAIVGPHGMNNAPLYEMLSRAGVEIPQAVTDSSVDFMRNEVIGWAESRCRSVELHMTVNYVIWEDAESALDYWRHSTFFDASRVSAVARELDEHFDSAATFTNTKCIMLAVLGQLR